MSSWGIFWKAIQEAILNHSSMRMTTGWGHLIHVQGLGTSASYLKKMGKIKIGLGLNCFIQLSGFQTVCVHLSGLNKSALRVLLLEWHLDCSHWRWLLSLIISASFLIRASKCNVDHSGAVEIQSSIILSSLWSNGTLRKCLKRQQIIVLL